MSVRAWVINYDCTHVAWVSHCEETKEELTRVNYNIGHRQNN